ncbi:SigE family RNA polymerase sigma factor [Catellatospora sp. KI3]|uniref:SigE family RNA polymerase sigma factor n=1 Tax=Catellatospora sp. KI3 TaxID=3041620 RepID=UPI0024828B98|nr:SigE family RNA polymerase sigma factor [Catellatospora sp. KI3]MDI1460156.1 SigE family RNA polymerase sigma factor [Catellatospora sp. KI3]
MTMSVTPPGGVPAADLASAPTRRAEASAADFDAFYQAHYAGTVAAAYALTADRAEAHDLAQEAYCRAWQRWAELARYDNPAAWVYRVTANLAHSRWRHLKVAAAHLVRQRPDTAAPPDPEHVALVAALRGLPADQRQAIVLHHLVDLPVSDVAREMGVPVGTVKSWLSRGRAELAVQLADPSRAAAVAPEAVRRRGDTRRRARRTALAGAAAAVLAVLVLVGFQWVRPFDGAPVPPAESPSPTVATPGPVASGPVVPGPSPAPVPSPAADDPITKVDFATATVALPAWPGCPSGTVTFRRSDSGTAVGGGGYPKVTLDATREAYGDLTGDGQAEAVLHATCLRTAEDSGDAQGQLLVVTRTPGGGLRALGWTGERGAVYPGFWVADGVLYAEMHPWQTGPRDYRPGMAYGFRWTGTAFAPVDVSAAYPPVLPSGPGRWLDLTPVADRLRCNSLPPKTGTLRPRFNAEGIADEGDREWLVRTGAPSNGPMIAWLDPAGHPYLLLLVECAIDDTPSATFDVQPSANLVVFDLAPDGWRALATVPLGPQDAVGGWSVAPDGRLTVAAAPLGAEIDPVTYTWTGLAFARSD